MSTFASPAIAAFCAACALIASLSRPASAAADTTCAWRGGMSASALEPVGCFAGASAALVLPGNTDRMARNGISLCRAAWNPSPRDADVLFLMDNSGSMEKGENSGGFNTPPGDPFGVRDRVIRRGIIHLRGQAGPATAGFLAFFGLGGNQDYTVEPEIETEKTQRPLDITVENPQGDANLRTLLRKVWKHNPNEALLWKASAEAKEAKRALTFWSETLTLARNWFSPDSGFTRSSNKAMVLISDGAIGDWKEVQALIPSLPPVHGIHLGDNNSAVHLKDLSAMTKGTPHIISPTDTAGFEATMGAIISAITGVNPPTAAKVVRTAPGVPDAVLDARLVLDTAGRMSVALPSDLPLKRGENRIRIQFTRNQVPVEMEFTVQVSGPDKKTSDARFACADPSSIFPGKPGTAGRASLKPADRDALGKRHPEADGKKHPVKLFRAKP